ncbi:hypothetical protein ACF0H5_002789 [Mactra antiquata]
MDISCNHSTTEFDVISLEDTNTQKDDKQKDNKVVEDPWALTEINIDHKAWSELTTTEKIVRVLSGIVKFILLIGCLYFFVCSLDLLSNAFRLIGGKTAGSVFQNNALLRNPVAGLMIGVLATVLLQSSSTTMGIAISLVVSKVIIVRDAIPIVMGANIGTSITNTLVSMGQITVKDEFRRAFAGATVHDMFNWMTVIVFLPIEACTGYLYHLTKLIVSSMDFPVSAEKRKPRQFLKKLTKPFTKLIIRVDKSVLTSIAQGDDNAYDMSIIKHCCKRREQFIGPFAESSTDVLENNVTSLTDGVNLTTRIYNRTVEKVCVQKCQFLFESVSWSDSTVGVVLLVMTLVLLTACFIILVRTIYSVLKGPILRLVKKFVNADFPGRLAFITGYVAIAIGTGTTMIIQSSSVFTSALTPLVGIGVVSIERMYPLTLGANLGTTFTAIIIALSQNAEDMPVAFHVALCHVFFNVSGIILFYPIPYMRVPIKMAKCLGNTTARYRWFAIMYMLLMFVCLPGVVFGLSSASWVALVGVVVPVTIIMVLTCAISVLQKRRPSVLPTKLRTWDFLPIWLRSLEPYDNCIKRFLSQFKLKCKCCFRIKK